MTQLPLEVYWRKTAISGVEIARSNYKPTRRDAVPVVFRTRLYDGYISSLKKEENELRRFAEGPFEQAFSDFVNASSARSESFLGEVASEDDILYFVANAEYVFLDEDDEDIMPYLDDKTLRELARKANVGFFKNPWRR